MKRKVFIIVLDSLGVGRMPDAPLFGDGDVNTLKRISSRPTSCRRLAPSSVSRSPDVYMRVCA